MPSAAACAGGGVLHNMRDLGASETIGNTSLHGNRHKASLSLSASSSLSHSHSHSRSPSPIQKYYSVYNEGQSEQQHYFAAPDSYLLSPLPYSSSMPPGANASTAPSHHVASPANSPHLSSSSNFCILPGRGSNRNSGNGNENENVIYPHYYHSFPNNAPPLPTLLPHSPLPSPHLPPPPPPSSHVVYNNNAAAFTADAPSHFLVANPEAAASPNQAHGPHSNDNTSNRAIITTTSSPSSSATAPQLPNHNPTPSGLQIVVHNLPWSCRWQQLKEHFSELPVQRTDIAIDAEGRSKGYGIVRFKDTVSAAIACERMNNSVLDGRVLSVRIDRFA
eukprot:CAMPEP_0175041604 /NCGR_PEP_ID=MMETSP0052_2-20121109/2018_1 /TAXON_ID=51329 ORGANISM="Polytomella parva, Strain SAG 63-3" /NCGR_SAMPLE_ID=MMETSP0052_2 /ASSEMBLY_ACC=CAM_ASM_000194 /LENGTH=333 /DNA_ID=CAMNT_0016304159 /DNA_START=232 /DNA_END=1233 /DNA_ORIENTATION=+